jgi:hypothetical protein
VERAIAATRIRDNQRLMVVLACLVLLGAVVFGLLSRAHSAPEPAALPTVAAQPEPLDREIDVVVVAIVPVDVTVRADGVVSHYTMAEGETRTVTAQTKLRLAVSDGGAIRLTIAGRDEGIPGQVGRPWSEIYTFDTGGSTSSPGA